MRDSLLRSGLALSVLVAGPAAAQTRGASTAALLPGASIAAALTADDDTLDTGEHVVRYPLDVPAGGAVEVRLASSAFDTYLVVVSPTGERRENDDYEGSTAESRVRVAAGPGRWEVWATSYAPGETGPYALSVRALTTDEAAVLAAEEAAEVRAGTGASLEALDARVDELTLLVGTASAARAEPLAREALARREAELGPDHPDVVRALNRLAMTLRMQERYAEARVLYERARALGEGNPTRNGAEVARSVAGLALLLEAEGDVAAARPLAEEALALRERALGPDHIDVARSLWALAGMLVAQDSSVLARPLYERALAIFEVRAPGQRVIRDVLDALGGVLLTLGDPGAARPVFERSLALTEAASGPDHKDVVYALDNLARTFEALGDYAAARRLYERALAIEEATGTPENVAFYLANLGNVLRRMEEPGTARPLYERALVLAEAEHGPYSRDIVWILDGLAHTLSDLDEHAGAEALFRRSLAIDEAALGLDHADVTASLQNVAGQRILQGDEAGARRVFEDALARAEAALGPDHADVAVSVWRLGSFLANRGEYAAARPYYERALAIREATSGPDELYVAESANNLAYLFETQGDYALAVPLYARALAIREAALGPDHLDIAESLRRLARVVIYNDPDAALPLLERALRIREATLGPTHPDVVELLLDVSERAQADGDLVTARDYTERALAIREATLGPDHSQSGWTRYLLSTVLEAQGDLAAARGHVERALAAAEAGPPVAQGYVPLYLNVLAGLLEAQGDYAGARRALERVLELHALDPPNLDPALSLAARVQNETNVAVTLSDLARVLLRQGHLAEARATQERSRAISERIRSGNTAEGLRDLAAILQAQGDVAGARALLERALAQWAALSGPDSDDLWRMLDPLASVVLAQGDTTTALRHAERALTLQLAESGPEHPYIAARLDGLAVRFPRGAAGMDRPALVLRAAAIRDGHAGRTLPTLAPAEQQAYVVGDLAASTNALLSFAAADSLARAYALLGGWKGLLLEGLRRQSAVAALASDPAHADDVAELLRLRGQVARAYRAGAPVLDSLTAAKETLERRLARALPDGAADDPWRAAGLGGLRAALPARSALADVYRYERLGGVSPGGRYAAVVTTTAATPTLVDLGPADSLDAAIAAWRDGRNRPGGATAALATAVWGPIAAALPAGTTRVWVSPDGDLARVPWGVLAEAHDGVADSTAGPLVAQVPSARALLAALTRPAAGADGPLLAVGDIDFGAVPADAESWWAALGGTAAEVRDVAALARAAGHVPTVLADSAATPAAVAAAMPGAAYVHLATHGFFGGESRADVEARAARSRRGVEAGGPVGGPDAPAGRSPLSASGLALAGANAGPEEGRLTAEEIVGLDLSAARLVVLSACDTGRGAEVTGQGVLGLQAAVGAAGARALLMSLWPVDDAATAALMAAFYGGLWTDRLAPAEALRRAQAAVREAPGWSAPTYWAGWSLVGDAF